MPQNYLGVLQYLKKGKGLAPKFKIYKLSIQITSIYSLKKTIVNQPANKVLWKQRYIKLNDRTAV